MVFTKMPMALMLAIDAYRNVSSATQSTDHSTSKRSWLRRSSRLGMGSGSSSAAAAGAPLVLLVIAIVTLPVSLAVAADPRPAGRLLHAQRSAVDAVVSVVRPALHLEPRIA